MRFNISELKEKTKNVNRLDFEKTSLDERMQSVSRLLEDKVQSNFLHKKFQMFILKKHLIDAFKLLYLNESFCHLQTLEMLVTVSALCELK